MALKAKDYIKRFAATQATFRIPTSANKDEDFIVRCITDVPSIMGIQEKANELLKISRNSSVLASWKPFLPITQQVATIVSEIVLLVQEPAFTDLEALELCKTAGAFASWLHLQIMSQYMSSIPQVEAEAIEKEKNALTPMESTAPI